MTGSPDRTVGPIAPNSSRQPPPFPRASTVIVWFAWAASSILLGFRIVSKSYWGVDGLASIDGLTAVTWCGVTFLSGIVHSYSLRYLNGDSRISAFFANALGLTASVMVLVAAEHLALFVGAWLAAGWAMSRLIGHVRDWAQARRARDLALRYFITSALLLAVAFVVAWQSTGATTVAGIGEQLAGMSALEHGAFVTCVLFAGTIQSALLPFHQWLMSSMTAPTPASALMHAGFVNAGGLLFTRFSSVFTTTTVAMIALVVIGAFSAIGGKLLKSVRSGVKNQLGCSTVGQMGFMIVQAGLGFFAASITHLILHGVYKAYLFLSSGERVTNAPPPSRTSSQQAIGSLGRLASAVIAVGGGGLFVLLTGKGWHLGTGTLLIVLVVLATYRATREIIARSDLPILSRSVTAPLLFGTSIAVYGAVYVGISGVLGSTATSPVTWPGHSFLVVLFAAVYLSVETGLFKQSDRLYVALLNASEPSDGTLMTSKEDYRE